MTLDAFPMRFCGTKDCLVDECHRCVVSGNAARQLRECSICLKIRCFPCAKISNAASINEGAAGLESMCRSLKPGEWDGAAIQRNLRNIAPDQYAECTSCWAACCFSCLDEESAKFVVNEFLKNGKNVDYRCPPCYWSAKPCTNPNCPNEVGVPTKRCGGCHLDRYCSVECQAVMYPDHADRCQKVQAKRAAAGKK